MLYMRIGLSMQVYNYFLCYLGCVFEIDLPAISCIYFLGDTDSPGALLFGACYSKNAVRWVSCIGKLGKTTLVKQS